MNIEEINNQVKQQICNSSSCPMTSSLKCGKERKAVCIPYQQALQILGGIQYEYESKIAEWSSDIKTVMNRMGTKGWQAIKIHDADRHFIIYFMRRKS